MRLFKRFSKLANLLELMPDSKTTWPSFEWWAHAANPKSQTVLVIEM